MRFTQIPNLINTIVFSAFGSLPKSIIHLKIIIFTSTTKRGKTAIKYYKTTYFITLLHPFHPPSNNKAPKSSNRKYFNGLVLLQYIAAFCGGPLLLKTGEYCGRCYSC
jgi:hypothetical protein